MTKPLIRVTLDDRPPGRYAAARLERLWSRWSVETWEIPEAAPFLLRW